MQKANLQKKKKKSSLLWMEVYAYKEILLKHFYWSSLNMTQCTFDRRAVKVTLLQNVTNV